MPYVGNPKDAPSQIEVDMLFLYISQQSLSVGITTLSVGLVIHYSPCSPVLLNDDCQEI